MMFRSFSLATTAFQPSARLCLLEGALSPFMLPRLPGTPSGPDARIILGPRPMSSDMMSSLGKALMCLFFNSSKRSRLRSWVVWISNESPDFCMLLSSSIRQRTKINLSKAAPLFIQNPDV